MITILSLKKPHLVMTFNSLHKVLQPTNRLFQYLFVSVHFLFTLPDSAIIISSKLCFLLKFSGKGSIKF